MKGMRGGLGRDNGGRLHKGIRRNSLAKVSKRGLTEGTQMLQANAETNVDWIPLRIKTLHSEQTVFLFSNV